MDIHLRLRAIWDNLQSSLWFRPIIAALLALVLALGSTILDSLVALPQIFYLAPDNARLILSAIANSMLTVVALTFSIIMVVLVLASQQFSPRILGNFARDHASQNVLSIFIGTFVYSLLVMGRINDTDNAFFIPVLSVIVAIFLALLSVGALIYFIDHISKTVQANYIIAAIDKQTVTVLHKISSEPAQNEYQATTAITKRPISAEECYRSYTTATSRPLGTRDEEKGGDTPRPAALFSEEGVTVGAHKRGYIQAIDFDELVRVGQAYNIVVQLERMVGDFVAERGDLLQTWPRMSISDDVIDRLLGVFEIGATRTLYEDVLFGLRQLVDIALKAISPAVNDPTTAVTCIDALSNILLQAVRYPDPPARYCDESGDVRLIVRPVTFKAMIDLAVTQIRQYARSEVTVSLRLLDMLAEIARATTEPQHHDVLWQHACVISRGANRGVLELLDRQQINERLNMIAQQLRKQPADLLLTTMQNDKDE
jgi:uncharacterized membrane protein